MKVSHFLFPKICAHCQTLLEKSEGLFCKHCSLFFEPINPKHRCFYCFNEDARRLCSLCRKKKRFLIPIGAIWEYGGPIETFIQKLKREELPSYMKCAAAFLALQLPRLSFPEPDFIAPVPSFALNFLWKGPSLNLQMAKILSHSISIPINTCLFTLDPNQMQFRLKNHSKIEGKKILLIDVALPDEEKWQAINQAFLEGEPEKIFGLTLACS